MKIPFLGASRSAPQAEPASTIPNDKLAAVLGPYVGLVDRVLNDPSRWLGTDEDPPPSAPFPLKVLDAVRDRAFGEVTPASSTWADLPAERRVDWWVTRIGISAGLAAAAPRFFGALVNRLPVQAGLGAAASGLAVCATAREHGVTAPADWVPLLGRVLFDRDLSSARATVPDRAESERLLSEESDADPQDRSTLTGGALRAARTLWRLTRALLEVDDLLDQRPRGGRAVRLVAQLPVIGVAGGWLDERGAIRSASRETAALVHRGRS